MALQTGKPFPAFSLQDQDNKLRSLKDFAGKWLVVYIYPKDDTPGCTLEGKGFTAMKSQFDKLNTEILGLSEDDVASHKNFCGKYSFTISLLADPQAKLLKALDVGQKEFKGQMYWNRTTFLIDPKGIIRKVYENVKADGHEKEVLKDLQQMTQ